MLDEQKSLDTLLLSNFGTKSIPCNSEKVNNLSDGTMKVHKLIQRIR